MQHHIPEQCNYKLYQWKPQHSQPVSCWESSVHKLDASCIHCDMYVVIL